FRDDLVVGVECMHYWYWISDLWEEHGIHFILGHALYMKAIHAAIFNRDLNSTCGRPIKGNNDKQQACQPSLATASDDGTVRPRVIEPVKPCGINKPTNE